MFYFIVPSCGLLFICSYFYYYYTNYSYLLQKFAFNIAYNLIHIYSKIQIVFQKFTLFISFIVLDF